MNYDCILTKYLRVSDDDGRYGDSQSIEGQRAILDDFIASSPEFSGAQILEFADDGWSGTNFNRPGVKEMLAKVKAGGINCILVKDFSRFGRSYIDVGDYLEQIFPFLRVRFISVNDHFDSNCQSSAGDLGVAFKSLCNDYYSKDLSRKVKAGIAALRGDGRCHSGFVPYGYMKASHDKNMIVPDEQAAPVVRRIFEMRLSGASTSEIAMALNAEGVSTPGKRKAEIYERNPGYNTDNVWLAGNIRIILNDIRYTGVLTEGMKTVVTVGSRRYRSVPREQWTVTPGTHDALVSEADFEKVQAKPVKKKQNFGEQKIYPLSKLVRCGGCGHTMTRKELKNPAYICIYKRYLEKCSCPRKSVKVTVVEETVTAALEKLFEFFIDNQAKKKKQTDKKAETAEALIIERKSLERHIESVQSDKLNAYNRYSENVISRDEYFRRRDEADAQIKLLTQQTEVLSRKIIMQREKREMPQENAFQSAMTGLSFSGTLTRELTEALIEKVLIYDGGRIEIFWKFPDPFYKKAVKP